MVRGEARAEELVFGDSGSVGDSGDSGSVAGDSGSGLSLDSESTTHA